VTAGFRVRSDGSAITDPAEAVDITQSLGWLEHKIIFDHRPLGAVVAEFNRYANIPIDIEDEKLKALPVTGTFDARDTDSFVAFLAVLPGVAVEREPTRIRVLRKVLAN
jgi:transmembrane sensor